MRKMEPDELDYEEEESPYRKYWVGAGAIVLLLLLVSYLLLAPVQHVVEGQLSSQSIRGQILRLADKEIIFLGNTTDVLPLIYQENQFDKLQETALCLMGDHKDSVYVVKDIFYPEIIDQSFDSVRFTSCPQDTIIMLHTHPFKSCKVSQTDIETYNKVSSYNPDVLMVVMCEENRYTVYGGI